MASVYVAIVLEGISDARARHHDAVRALASLETELTLDRSDLTVIVAAQRDRDARHRRIARWLTAPRRAPSDSLTSDFRALFTVNRTMFPRNSSWTTMVASGQLADLDDAQLVARLANFYENLNARLEYNGVVYDDWVTDVARTAVPEVWDSEAGRFLTTDPIEIRRLSARLHGIHDLSLEFIDLLGEWGLELDTVIDEVDAYLEREGARLRTTS